ncbi:rod-binding protein [Gemmobacter fulvus]|uniref:rod-binding protein n=1 Tax=Gemmobacter fulvus TaxID=2840474 RepID=UPI0027965C8F|nr:rod-binding protein [Gemmobacter fulvus]MDQ1849862.1 rod-binding protein [Gemmobacter fulvus]
MLPPLLPDPRRSCLGAPSAALPDRQAQICQKAIDLEQIFLAEMLAHAGMGNTAASFGGGIGETQFASFLRQEQARAMVTAGGIGLSESLFKALTEADTDGN